ncbi:hypothetical protein RV15_GL002850 [Enterococcus silesiacus]|uniref:Uncharacterized protein n=1 Tax=Enterococcus silesiacus TaxID=332949 RepID=A0AA91GFL8_9ENTE|nr:hypothetical protein RV15_GL002850 [Enterococcus silesiacus]
MPKIEASRTYEKFIGCLEDEICVFFFKIEQNKSGDRV